MCNAPRQLSYHFHTLSLPDPLLVSVRSIGVRPTDWPSSRTRAPGTLDVIESGTVATGAFGGGASETAGSCDAVSARAA